MLLLQLGQVGRLRLYERLQLHVGGGRDALALTRLHREVVGRPIVLPGRHMLVLAGHRLDRL